MPVQIRSVSSSFDQSVALKHPAGTLRIALLGDSYIEAFEVPFEKTAGEVLERRLSALRGTPVEVLNFGEGGYGTGQELLTLQHEVWKYSPDLVLLALTPSNDISDNYRPLKRTDSVARISYWTAASSNRRAIGVEACGRRTCSRWCSIHV